MAPSRNFVLAIVFALLQLPATAYAQTTVRVALSNLPTSLGDPFRTVAFPATVTFAALFDGLTWIDREGEVHPGLAVTWEPMSETTWRLGLREGVRFSNGEPFDATAVTNVFDYLLGPDGMATMIGREVAPVERVDVIDPYTVEIKTKAPFPTLPRALGAVMVPAPGHWRALGPDGFANDPVGSGAFKVDEWGSGGVSLSVYDHAWRRPAFDKLELVVVPEQQARMQALQSGAVDIALAVGPDDRGAVEAMGGTFVRSLAAGNLVIALRTSLDGPVKDKKVRQALNYAVNKQAMIDVLLDGAGNVASQPVVPATNGYNPALEPYWYDPDKAKALLKEAGYEDGFDLTIEIALGTGANIDTILEQTAADLRAVGIRVTLRTITLAELARRVYDGNWQGEGFALTMNTAPTLDALGPFRMHSCEWVKPWHCRPEDTPLIVAARQEFDPVKREELIHELLRRYHEDPPAIYVVQLVGFTGLSPKISNYKSDFGVIRFHELEVDE